MEQALIDLALAQAVVTDLVGPNIYWGERAPRTGLPAVVFHLISDRQAEHMKGQEGASDCLVQADCLALTAPQAVTLGNTLRAALKGYRGGGFDYLFADFRLDDSTAGGAGEATVFRRVLEIRCVFNRG